MLRKLSIFLILGALSFGVLAQDPTTTAEPTVEGTLPAATEGTETAEGTLTLVGTVTPEGSRSPEATPSADGSTTAEGTLTLVGTVTPEGSRSPEATPSAESTDTAPQPTLEPTLAATDEPPPATAGVQPAANVTIQQIVDDPTAYYGVPVALEGDIKDFINSRMFVLNEGAVVDSDEVLIVNTSDVNFDPWVVTGRHYQLVGIVQPSYNEMGGLEALNAAAAGDVETLAENTARWSLNDLLALSIMDGIESHTIIEVMDASQVVGFANLNEIASNDLRYTGYNFYVLGTVGSPVTANSFLLTEDALLDADRVLVVNADTSGISEGQHVKIWGQIGSFPYFQSISDAGFDLNDGAFVDYQDYTVLRAESIEILP